MAPFRQTKNSIPLKAFTNCSVDYAGPFITRQGRRRSDEKRYSCRFVCQDTKAVHIEMATNLSSDAFLNCFQRFVSRRGIPTTVVSDNGTNFVGVQDNLRNLFSSDSVADVLAHKGVRWIFCPPSAPHFNGLAEAMVKSVRKALFHVLSQARCTDEELNTALIKAEFFINSRPITYLSSSIKDEEVLTPNHFLFGQPGGKYSMIESNSQKDAIQLRWKFLGDLLLKFWQRWMLEWIPAQTPRSKWRRECEPIHVGDIVTVLDRKNAFNQWPVGKVVEIYTGVDKLPRSAMIKVGVTHVVRPLTKLCKIC